MKLTSAPLIIMALALSGCFSPQQGLISNPNTTRSIQAQSDDLKLSCVELNTRKSRLEARLVELDQEAKIQRRKDAVSSGLMSVGAGILTSMGARGGIDGLRTSGAIIQGVDAVSNAEGSQKKLSNITDTISIAQRHSQLQRAAVEKGCQADEGGT